MKVLTAATVLALCASTLASPLEARDGKTKTETETVTETLKFTKTETETQVDIRTKFETLTETETDIRTRFETLTETETDIRTKFETLTETSTTTKTRTLPQETTTEVIDHTRSVTVTAPAVTVTKSGKASTTTFTQEVPSVTTSTTTLTQKVPSVTTSVTTLTQKGSNVVSTVTLTQKASPVTTTLPASTVTAPATAKTIYQTTTKPAVTLTVISTAPAQFSTTTQTQLSTVTSTISEEPVTISITGPTTTAVSTVYLGSNSSLAATVTSWKTAPCSLSNSTMTTSSAPGALATGAAPASFYIEGSSNATTLDGQFAYINSGSGHLHWGSSSEASTFDLNADSDLVWLSSGYTAYLDSETTPTTINFDSSDPSGAGPVSCSYYPSNEEIYCSNTVTAANVFGVYCNDDTDDHVYFGTAADMASAGCKIVHITIASS